MHIVLWINSLERHRKMIKVFLDVGCTTTMAQREDKKNRSKKLVWYSLVWFYGTLTIVGYLVPNPFYTYKVLFQQFSLI